MALSNYHIKSFLNFQWSCNVPAHIVTIAMFFVVFLVKSKKVITIPGDWIKIPAKIKRNMFFRGINKADKEYTIFHAPNRQNAEGRAILPSFNTARINSSCRFDPDKTAYYKANVLFVFSKLFCVKEKHFLLIF